MGSYPRALELGMSQEACRLGTGRKGTYCREDNIVGGDRLLKFYKVRERDRKKKRE